MANWKYLALGSTGLALTAGAYFWVRRQSDVDVLDTKGEETGGGGGGGGAGGGGGGAGGGGAGSGGAGAGAGIDNVGTAGDPPPISDPRWKNVPVEIQKLLTKVQTAADVPYLWVMGSIIAQGEASFLLNAHNNDAKERKGSRDGLKNGLARGNPKPKFAEAIEEFGSGGLFGALAPYFAWIGLDEGYMPFLRRKPELMFDGPAACVFMAHYFWRVTSPNYAKGRTLNMFDVRVGWASPSKLKTDPLGAYAQEVRGRMRESISVIGWDEKWVESLPIVRGRYRGIQSVAPAMGFSPAQED